jgi:WD40 repeat protein/tetratricopeptide (TPR) repeat protein
MGIVYHARQLNPEREVALKVIRTDRLADLSEPEQRQWLERFRREARVIASLEQHPNLVTLYEVGELDSRPFFTMQLVRGGSLVAALHDGHWKTGSKESAIKAASLVAAVARAVHHVHQRGLLHRDLKPGNILLDGNGRPLVSDFGLARRLDQSGSLVAGAIEGRAEYMAPEQARGLPGAVTTAADVYSLGAVLYALLTGRPPFKGASYFETLMQVINDAPTSPRLQNSALPRDLEIICLTCLEKEPSRRYGSAAALADDLENWLAGRPILARPVGAAGRLWRWCRRNPALAAAAMTILFVVFVAGASIIQSRDDALDAASKATAAEKEASQTAEQNAELARRNGILAGEEKEQRRNVQRELARLAVQEGLSLCENQSDCARGLGSLVFGLETAEKVGEADLAHAIRTNLTVWSRNLIPQRAILLHENWPEIHRAVFSSDGRLVATACGDGAIRVWETASGKQVGQPFGTPRRPKVIPPPKDLPTNPAMESVVEIAPEDDPAFAVTFSPDGQWIAGGSLRGRVRVWEVTTGRLLREFQHHDGAKDKAFRTNRGQTYANNGIVGLAFRPDGKALIAAGSGGVVRIWDPSSGASLADLPNPGLIKVAELSPDGHSLLVGCALRGSNAPHRVLVVLWDTATGKPRYNPLPHAGEVLSATFSPDGRWFAIGSGKGQGGKLFGEAQLWETATGKPVGAPHRFAELVKAVAFSPDGHHWLAAGSEGTMRLFDREAGLRFEGRVGGPTGGRGAVGAFGKGLRIVAAAFSPDGRTFVTAGESIQAWDVAGMAIGEILKVHRSSVHHVAFSSDGRTLLTAASDGTARLWEAPTSRPPPGRSLHLSTSASRVVFSQDSRRVLIGTWARGALLFEPGKSKPPVLLEHTTAATEVDLSPDGRLALTGGYDQTARLWDVATGVKLGELTGVERILAVAFSPDSQTAAISGQAFRPGGGGIYLWDVASRQPRKTRILEGVSVSAFAFCPGSRILVAADGDTVRFYRVTDCHATGIAVDHGAKVEVVAFSPDGAQLLTAGGSSVARLWDAATGKVIRDFSHRKTIAVATFSPDGRIVLTASFDGTAQAWRTATGEPAGPPLIHRQPVTAAALGKDGRTALTGCQDGSVRLWDARAGLPISPPLHYAGAVRCAALSPDGRTAVWGGAGTTLEFRTLPTDLPCSTQKARDWAEALTGFANDADHAVRLLEPDRWQETRDRLRLDGEALLAIEDEAAWHAREAEECEMTGQWFPAQWHLQRMLDARPDDSDLLRRRGVAAARLAWWDRATELLTSAIARGADSADVRLERGKALVQVGRRDLAEADFSAGVQRWPDAWGPWQARGFMRAEAGQWCEAVEDLRKAAELPGAPLFVGSQQAIACLRHRDLAGYHAACAALVRRLERGEAWNDEVRQTPDVVWPCCLCPSAGAEPARLRQLAERAAEPAKGGMEYYPLVRTLGASLYRARDYQGAIQVLSRATALNDQAPTVWLLIAMSYHRLGKAAEARRALDAARKWMAQSRLEEAFAYRLGWAMGIAADPWGLGPTTAFAAFAGFPVGDIGKTEKRARPWRQLPWPEQQALEMLRFEAENLIAGKRPAG